MNKYIISGLLAFMAIGVVGCSDDEEILTPTTDRDDIKFAVPENATGPEADLRRQFFKDNGSYLMFSDLLKSTYQGKDANGKDIYKNEYIDFRFKTFLDSDPSYAPQFVFMDDDVERKQAGVSLVNEYIIPHVAGTNLLPFSILLVESMKVYEIWEGWVDAKDTSCWRCMAIAVGEWLSLSEDEREIFAKDILKDMVSVKFTYSHEKAKPFIELSKVNANQYLSDIFDDWDRDMDRVYNLGFLEYYEGWRGPSGDYLPKYYEDFEMYLAEVITRDKDDFESQYGNYPAIMEKYNIILDALVSIGYKF